MFFGGVPVLFPLPTPRGRMEPVSRLERVTAIALILFCLVAVLAFGVWVVSQDPMIERYGWNW